MDGPIILLTVDALRFDRLSSDVFPECQPHFDDFATWTNAYSHGVATPFAFPSLLSTEFVENDGSISGSAVTLAEKLQARRTVGFGNNPHLIAGRGYDRGFDEYHYAAPPDEVGTDVLFDRIKRFGRSLPLSGYANDIISKTKKGISNHDIPSPSYADASDVVDFVARQIQDVERVFVWAHFMDPHFPFDPDAVLDRDRSVPDHRSISETVDKYLNNQGDVDLDFIKQLYDTNIRYLDNQLAHLFSKLKDLDVYDESLIILTADHGELFGEGGRTAHPWDCDPIDALIQVPLLAKFPHNRIAGEEFEHLVRHKDIGATIESITDEYDGWGSGYPLMSTEDRLAVSLSNAALRERHHTVISMKAGTVGVGETAKLPSGWSNESKKLTYRRYLIYRVR